MKGIFCIKPSTSKNCLPSSTSVSQCVGNWHHHNHQNHHLIHLHHFHLCHNFSHNLNELLLLWVGGCRKCFCKAVFKWKKKILVTDQPVDVLGIISQLVKIWSMLTSFYYKNAAGCLKESTGTWGLAMALVNGKHFKMSWHYVWPILRFMCSKWMSKSSQVGRVGDSRERDRGLAFLT